MSNKIKELFIKIKTDQAEFRRAKTDGKSKSWKAFHYLIALAFIFYDEITKDKLFVKASALAYTTMLSLIPLLVVGGSLVLMFNKSVTQADIINLLKENVLPVAGDTIAKFLEESLQRTLEIGTGPVGGITLFVTAVLLFIQIEDIINDIWNVENNRSFYVRVLLFYAIVSLGPLAISISIYQAAKMMGDLESNEMLRRLALYSVSVLIFFLTYKLFPSTKVKWKNALIPAITVAISFELLKFGFAIYISQAFTRSYSILYGALGLIPVVLLWIYIMWVLVLFGAKLGYILQNMRRLGFYTSFDRDGTNQNTWQFIGLYAPIEIFAAMVRAYYNENLPQSSENLSMTCNCPLKAVEAIMKRLEEASITQWVELKDSGGYILKKPLENINLWDLLNVFNIQDNNADNYPKLKQLLDELYNEQQKRLEQKNATHLQEINSP